MSTRSDPANRRAGRPRSFSDEELVRAAVVLGPESLSLSEIAGFLDVPRTTVYNRVATPQALGALVLRSKLDDVLAREWTAPSGSWQTALTGLINHFRSALVEAGPWIRFYDVNAQLDSRSMQRTEAVLRRMIDQGLTLEEAGRAIDLTMSLLRDDAVMRASIVFQGSITDRARQIAEAEGLELMLDSITRSAAVGEDDRFSYGLARAIEGVESAHRRSRPVRRRGSRES